MDLSIIFTRALIYHISTGTRPIWALVGLHHCCDYLRCSIKWGAFLQLGGLDSGNVINMHCTPKACQFHNPAIVEYQHIESCK